MSPFTLPHLWSVYHLAYSLCSLMTLAVAHSLPIHVMTDYHPEPLQFPPDTYKVDKPLAFSMLVTFSSTSIVPHRHIHTVAFVIIGTCYLWSFSHSLTYSFYKCLLNICLVPTPVLVTVKVVTVKRDNIQGGTLFPQEKSWLRSVFHITCNATCS